MANSVTKILPFIFVLSLLFTPFAFAEEKASASSAKINSIKENKLSDQRVKILRDYLRQYNSPLVEYSSSFVKYADEYNLDWRLVAAISGVESTFGQQIPYGTYNGWGWGIYGDNRIYFKSWDEGIKTVSEGLRTNYLNRWGAQDVYQIGRLYAASPTWAYRVDYFMGKIQDFSLRNPQSTLSLAL
ncbi:MAG TPA: hypothetical protein VFA93_00610 [Patescibacteria group bacterium]|nr:hypothetical protein [Patescibacteria group bacterium]